MKRQLLLLLAVGACALGATESPNAPAAPAPVRAPSAHRVVSAGNVMPTVDTVAVTYVTADDGEAIREEVRRQIRRASTGTYIGEMLAERDSSLARWPDRHGIPLQVWIQPVSPVMDWSAAYVDSVRAAFMEWNTVHLPVNFAFTSDSASADVHVSWIDRFDEQISGRTKWARDDNWWITDGDIVLAVHHHGGEILELDAMKAMALHEVGHLIGLDHTSNDGSIMAPRVRIRDLAQVDVATARLLYSLPAGGVR